jgi:hypothetical protein
MCQLNSKKYLNSEQKSCTILLVYQEVLINFNVNGLLRFTQAEMVGVRKMAG